RAIRVFGCGGDNAVGGALPQIGAESPVFGETEGERREKRTGIALLRTGICNKVISSFVGFPQSP
ncbi:hypothetical protein ILYODFUR_001434, partial [Ilyodon furcidens]